LCPVGAYHESELQFILGEPYLNYSNHLRSYDDKKMSDLMMNIWADFVRHGFVLVFFYFSIISSRNRVEMTFLNFRTPTPKVKVEKSEGLNFQWTNYSEYHQDFTVLGLKSHLDKYFLTDRFVHCYLLQDYKRGVRGQEKV